jgi:hypothetical protein
MKKIREFVKNMTPKKLIGIQFIYLSLILAIAYTIGNEEKAVRYEGKIMSEDAYWSRYDHLLFLGEFVFNQPLFEQIIIYSLLVDGFFIGYWFLKKD